MNKIIDINCLLGHWPFRKLYKNTFDDLRQIHSNNNISYGYVSSINSIFYNDPFEGEEELHNVIKNSDYCHVLTINPTLPCFIDDIEKGLKLFDIRGVKLYPGYHGYQLDNKYIDDLCTVLEKYNLPLFINLRMEDERLCYLFQPQSIPLKDIGNFLNKNKNITIVLLGIRFGELINLKDVIISNSHVFFDTSGLKDQLFSIEKLLKIFHPEKILYGSQYPLYCLKSTLLLLEKAEIDEESRQKILSKNAELINRKLIF